MEERGRLENVGVEGRRGQDGMAGMAGEGRAVLGSLGIEVWRGGGGVECCVTFLTQTLQVGEGFV